MSAIVIPTKVSTGEHTRYEVQFTIPCEEPENNVRRKFKRGTYCFEVPINHPLAHNLGYQDLLAAAIRYEGIHTVHRP